MKYPEGRRGIPETEEEWDAEWDRVANFFEPRMKTPKEAYLLAALLQTLGFRPQIAADGWEFTRGTGEGTFTIFDIAVFFAKLTKNVRALLEEKEEAR